jgi:hypothetical protein
VQVTVPVCDGVTRMLVSTTKLVSVVIFQAAFVVVHDLNFYVPASQTGEEVVHVKIVLRSTD